MHPDNEGKFRDLLEQNHQWPDYYTFKFIVKVEHQERVLAALEGHEVLVKTSEKGNYVSITSRLLVNATDEVMEVYRLVHAVPGVMSL